MAMTAQLAPFVRDKVIKTLRNSTMAAVQTCTGGDNGRVCGFRWTKPAFDGHVGAGQEMNVLAALSSLLVAEPEAISPVTDDAGGTSVGDVLAGAEAAESLHVPFEPLGTGDKAGAGILTAVIVGLLIAMIAFMSTSWTEEKSEQTFEKPEAQPQSQIAETRPEVQPEAKPEARPEEQPNVGSSTAKK